MTYMAQRVSNFDTTIFLEMTNLANQHRAINLGQGIPDFPAPDFIKRPAIKAIQDDINQYAPGNGQPKLRRAIAEKMARHYGLPVNPDTEITVTNGATEAIFASILSLVNPGDEVIIFEPFYDSYMPAVQIAGGRPHLYILRPPHWSIDKYKLAKLFSDKTKLILLNTPHNPTGKVYSENELRQIADLCHRHDVIVVTDEVYEHITFDGYKHRPMAALPGMANRTITISSLGKTFNVTGWKVGWAIAAPELSQTIFRSHQFMTYCAATPLQEGAATALRVSRNYYTKLTAMYQDNRDFLLNALREAGLKPIIPRGTYFIMVDISHLGFPNDVAFCRHLITKIGVAAIPPSSFYHDPTDGAQLARFSFCKNRAALEEAARRLKKLKTKT